MKKFLVCAIGLFVVFGLLMACNKKDEVLRGGDTVLPFSIDILKGSWEFLGGLWTFSGENTVTVSKDGDTGSGTYIYDAISGTLTLSFPVEGETITLTHIVVNNYNNITATASKGADMGPVALFRQGYITSFTFQGEWVQIDTVDHRIIFNGNNFTYKENGVTIITGTFTYTEDSITFSQPIPYFSNDNTVDYQVLDKFIFSIGTRILNRLR